MTAIQKIALYFTVSAVLTLLVMPPLIKLLKKVKAGQNILGYVVQHESKAGTPTMGGVVFALPVVIFALVERTPLALVAMSMIIGFGALGFLDDFIKIRFNRNLGLKAYQKIIGQVGLSVIVGVFVYKSGLVGSEINLPYLSPIDLKWGIIPFVAFTFIATTNSVNLTDGLDGLAGTTCLGYFLIVGVATFLQFSKTDGELQDNLFSLVALCAVLVGALSAYLVFNSSPARVFMGDTGSLALGGAVASVAVLAKNPVFILTSGIMFVWSSISVIVQVISFKSTGKRVFKMSPFHHHLEMCGMSETKICAIYLVATLIGGAVTLVLGEGI